MKHIKMDDKALKLAINTAIIFQTINRQPYSQTLVTITFNCMEKSSMNIALNFSFSVRLKKLHVWNEIKLSKCS